MNALADELIQLIHLIRPCLGKSFCCRHKCLSHVNDASEKRLVIGEMLTQGKVALEKRSTDRNIRGQYNIIVLCGLL